MYTDRHEEGKRHWAAEGLNLLDHAPRSHSLNGSTRTISVRGLRLTAKDRYETIPVDCGLLHA